MARNEAKRDSGGKRRTAAFDLDGTLAEYDRWRGWQHVGKPRPGAIDLVREFHLRGWKTIIFTTRGNIDVVWDWVDEHMPGMIDHVNQNPDNERLSCNPGKPLFSIYFEDRSYPFSKTWGRPFPSCTEILDDLLDGGFFEAHE